MLIIKWIVTQNIYLIEIYTCMSSKFIDKKRRVT